MRYRIYWNSHKRLYSVQTRQPVAGKRQGDWRLWKHADAVVLDNVTFDVSEAGQRRCRREGRKNVHAYLVAEYATFRFEHGFGQLPDEEGERVTYNPHTDEGFMVGSDVVTWANVVRCRTADGRAHLTAYGASSLASEQLSTLGLQHS
jgi:hypothetical protein